MLVSPRITIFSHVHFISFFAFLQMQSGGLMDFGDSPSDVLKWTRERESQKNSSPNSAGATVKRYGEWDSPITSKLVTGKTTPISRQVDCDLCASMTCFKRQFLTAQYNGHPMK